MREIKFRGKRYKHGKSGDDWVYGDFYHSSDGRACIGEWLVKEKTVSEFTGLKDKNGKEIYEGDMFEAWERSKYVIEWNGQNACFQLVWAGGDSGDSRMNHYFNMLMAEYQFDKIGNIHDNPELLK